MTRKKVLVESTFARIKLENPVVNHKLTVRLHDLYLLPVVPGTTQLHGRRHRDPEAKCHSHRARSSKNFDTRSAYLFLVLKGRASVRDKWAGGWKYDIVPNSPMTQDLADPSPYLNCDLSM